MLAHETGSEGIQMGQRPQKQTGLRFPLVHARADRGTETKALARGAQRVCRMGFWGGRA